MNIKQCQNQCHTYINTILYLSEISCSRIIVYFHRNLVDTWQWMQYKHIGRSQLHFLFVQDIEIFHADIIFFVEETFFFVHVSCIGYQVPACVFQTDNFLVFDMVFIQNILTDIAWKT